MKILQINKFFFLKGGAEKYFFDLSELLVNKGHYVSVWSTRHPENFKWPEQKNFITYYDYSQKQGFLKDIKKVINIFWNFEAKRKLEKLLKKEKPVLAHLHNFHHHFSPSIVSTLKKHKIPVVMTLHDYKMFCPNHILFSRGKICTDCLKRKNWSCFRKKCVKNSYLKSSICVLEAKWQEFLGLEKKIDVFTAPSLFMKKQAIKWGLAKEKIFHLPYFLPKENKKELFPENEKAKPSKPYFLYFGRLSPEKGIDILIRAFDKIWEKYPHWRLKIVGDGPDRKNLKNLLGVNYRNIEFLGRKKGRQLKKIISQAYLVIVPSIWPENYPYVILESFSQGKPVIGSRIGGIPELVKDKKTGLLFEPNNINDLTEKIKYAIKYRRAIIRMGQEAKNEIISKAAPDKHYQKLIKIYSKLIL